MGKHSPVAQVGDEASGNRFLAYARRKKLSRGGCRGEACMWPMVKKCPPGPRQEERSVLALECSVLI
jgi:hypothetical protein